MRTNTTPLEEAVAGNVRAEMARQKLGTADLAALLGLQMRAAQRRYSGDLAYTLNEIALLAEWLGIDRSELFAVRRVAEKVPA